MSHEAADLPEQQDAFFPASAVFPASADLPAQHAAAPLSQDSFLLSFALPVLAVLLLSAVFVPFIHGVQFAQSLGFSLQTASTVISSIGVGGLVGRMTMGPLSDRIGRRYAVIFAFAFEAISFAGFAFTFTRQRSYLDSPTAEALQFSLRW